MFPETVVEAEPSPQLGSTVVENDDELILESNGDIEVIMLVCADVNDCAAPALLDCDTAGEEDK